MSDLIAQLTALFDGVFDTIEPLVVRTSGLLTSPSLQSAELHALDELAVAAVTETSGLVVGAGYVAAPTALADAKYWLQWWSDYDTPRTGRPQRLRVELDPAGESFRDYTELSWYSVPAETHARHVAGPYVDYLCTDEYTLTFTVPVFADGEFAGVVGADVYAQAIDKLATPLLGRLRGAAALINPFGRVVAAARSSLITGDLVDEPTLTRALHDGAGQVADGTELHRLARLPFTLAVGPAVSA